MLHPEGSQGRIREAAIESFGTVLYDRTVQTGELRLKRGLVAGGYEGVQAGFLEHSKGAAASPGPSPGISFTSIQKLRMRLECSVRFVEREASTAPFLRN